MKGFVLHFSNKNKGIFFTRIKEFRNKLCCGLKSRGISALLLCSFFIGMTAGAALAGGFDKETLNKLDILFISNIPGLFKNYWEDIIKVLIVKSSLI